MTGPRRWLAVDIGGTFTDVVLASENHILRTAKVRSTPSDFARGFATALDTVLEPDDYQALASIAHGTTVATNAILQRSGPDVGLLTTEGFADVLELRRSRRPHLYDLGWTPPPPLAKRRHCYQVRGRLGTAGEEIVPLALEDLAALIEDLKSGMIGAVAICLLNSPSSARHERQARDCILSQVPAAIVTISSDVCPVLREFERASTTVANAYLLPLVDDYTRRVAEHVASRTTAALTIMRSDGSTSSIEATRSEPVSIIESGPAAGVVAARALCRGLRVPLAITFDMGGTTAKASMIEDYRVGVVEEFEVGGPVTHHGSRASAGGYVIRRPCIDLAEVSAGGGSIAWVDAGGALRVGPDSAGADPGPVCFGLGGTQPTVTDAHVVLGYANPSALAGGRLPISAAQAEASIAGLAGQLGVSVLDAAYGVFEVATSAAAQAIRAVSLDRGRDPRDAALVAFGGAGGIHAAQLADDLNIRTIVIPSTPGVFSAIGLFAADRSRTVSADLVAAVEESAMERLHAAITTMMREVGLDGPMGEDEEADITVSLRQVGQPHSLALTLPAAELLGPGSHKQLRARFGVHYEHTFGYYEPGPVEITGLRLTVRPGISDAITAPIPGAAAGGDSGQASFRERAVCFGRQAGTLPVPVIARRDLPAGGLEGPLVIEEDDSSSVVPPGWHCAPAAFGSLLLRKITP